MLARVQSFVLTGIDATACEVEVDVDDRSLERQQVVGLPDAAVRESIERTRSAILNSGYRYPNARLLINLAPAELRKEGPVYDLPMAIGVLMADGAIAPMNSDGARKSAQQGAHNGERESTDRVDIRRFLIAGELALDGRLRPIRGVIAMASLAASLGLSGVIVPAENVTEAAVVEGVEAIGVRTLSEVVGLLNGQIEPTPHPRVDVAAMLEDAVTPVDFADVRGQEAVKRAITVAAAGAHNILMLGPAGTGKTMMARAFPGVLPPMTPGEALEVTRIYSAAGRLKDGRESGGLVTIRPVRSPHHTSSSAAIIGGGTIPSPGEVSLAHRGVLFLDELPEFPRAVLETLRQPLEDGSVTVARAHSSVSFPADFLFVAALNPTPKGAMPTDQSSQREMDRYLSRISGPLVDRVDIHVEAPAVPWRQLTAKSERGTSSAQMRERVLEARQRQRARQGDTLNAALSGKRLDEMAMISDSAMEVLRQAITELGFSARAYDKIRRVARTIADLDASEVVDVAPIAEAVQYRLLDRRL